MGQTIYATSPLAIGQIIYVTVPSKPCGAPSRRRAPPGAGSATDASTHATSPPETCGLHPAGHDLLQGAGTTRRGERDRRRDVLAERGARVDLVDVRVTPRPAPEAPAADQSAQTTMSGTGMTQEMEALAFEGDEGFDLTDEEVEESARAYDEAQVPAN